MTQTGMPYPPTHTPSSRLVIWGLSTTSLNPLITPDQWPFSPTRARETGRLCDGKDRGLHPASGGYAAPCDATQRLGLVSREAES